MAVSHADKYVSVHLFSLSSYDTKRYEIVYESKKEIRQHFPVQGEALRRERLKTLTCFVWDERAFHIGVSCHISLVPLISYVYWPIFTSYVSLLKVRR